MAIAEKIHYLQQLIDATLQSCQRQPNTVKILAVSKGQSIAAIEAAYKAGLSDFGENYWQEAHSKILNLCNLPLAWHFIGAIQSNKAKEIAHYFSWVQSVDRQKIAHLLALHRPQHLPPLNVCIQINLDNEDTKSGLTPNKLAALANYITQLPTLRLRGLMAIPKPRLTKEEQYNSLKRLATLFEDTNQQLNLEMDTLSMGMSDDLEPAVRAGATLIRLGRAIFGERTR